MYVFHHSNGTRKIKTGSEKSDGISAMCLSPNKKYLAVAEKTVNTKSNDIKKNPPTIRLYDTQTFSVKKGINFSNVGSHEFVCVAFSNDGRYLVAQGGAPEYNLVLWSLEGKTRVVDHICTSTNESDPVFQCSISPDNRTICVTGNGIFKLLTIDEREKLKIVVESLGKRDREPYLAHSWIGDERLVVSNANGDLFIVEGNEYKFLLPSSPSDGLSITSIVSYGSGFVCGGEMGVLSLYDRATDDKEMYSRMKTLKIGSNSQFRELNETYLDHKIMSMGLSPTNENLIISTSSAQIFTLNISSSDILQKEDDIKFEYLTIPFHSKAITGMDTCIRKPIVVTCSLDKTVRVFNYLDSTLNIVKQYSSEAHAIAIHPNGYHLVVGFTDKLRFMNILGDDIREQKSFLVRNCTEIKFSNGGNYFAAAHGNVINVYNTFTLQLTTALKGHNGKIKAIQWSDDDTKLISVGLDGALYEYVVKTEKRIIHNTNKSAAYTSVFLDSKNIYVGGTDGKVRGFADASLFSEYDIGEILLGCVEFAPSHKMVFGGMENGCIEVHSFPNIDLVEDRLQLHAGPINRIVKSFDENYLFTGGEDGMLSIIEVRDREGGKAKRETKFSEEILISITDWEEKNNTIAELQAKVHELKSDNDFEQKKKQVEFNTLMREQANNFNLEIQKQQEEFKKIQQEKKSLSEEYEKKIDDIIEKHREKLKALEQDFNDRLNSSLNQITEINKEREKEKKQLLDELKAKEEQHIKELTETTEELEDEIKKRENALQLLQEEKSEKEKQFNETKSQMEEDQENEIKILKERFKKELAKKEEECNQAKSEYNKYYNKYLEADKRDKKNAEKMKELELKRANAENLNKQYQEDIQKTNEENKDREEAIIEKEKSIFKLKRQNQELEKFRFVLEYKITELQEQIKPKQDEIDTLKKETKKMRKELEKGKERTDKLMLIIKDLKLKIEGRVQEIQKLNYKLKDSETLTKRVRADIYKVAQLIQEPKLLKDEVTKLYQTYVSEQITKQEMDLDIQKEYERQRSYLEKTVDSLKKKLVKATETSRSDNKRTMNENVLLIREINELRKEVRTLKSKLKDKELEQKIGRINSLGDLNNQNLNQERTSSAGGLIGGVYTLEQALKELEMQRQKIKGLRDKIDELEAEKKAMSRPISRERLPPVMV
ncbi:hypothetical protein ABK040_010273 [Willaertia magna]